MTDPYAAARIVELQEDAQAALQDGEMESARELLYELLAQCEEAEDVRCEALCWHRLGAISLGLGEADRACSDTRTALMLYRDLQDGTGYAAALQQLGAASLGRGEVAEARRLSREAAQLQEERGDAAGVARSLYQVAASYVEEDDIAAAARAFGEAIRVMSRAGDFAGIGVALQSLAAMAERSGRLEESFRFMAASAAVQAGSKQPTADDAMEQAREQAEKAAIDPELFDAALAEATSEFLSDDGARMIAAAFGEETG